MSHYCHIVWKFYHFLKASEHLQCLIETFFYEKEFCCSRGVQYEVLGGRNFDAPKEFLHLAKTNFNLKQMRIMQYSDKCSQIVFDSYDGEHVKFVCAYNRLTKVRPFFLFTFLKLVKSINDFNLANYTIFVFHFS